MISDDVRRLEREHAAMRAFLAKLELRSDLLDDLDDDEKSGIRYWAISGKVRIRDVRKLADVIGSI